MPTPDDASARILRIRIRPPRKILVIATRQIGDVLLTTPLIRRARLLWPVSEIDVLGFAETLGMLQGNPDVHKVLAAPSHGGAAGILRFAFSQKLWRRYDLALVTQHSDRAHLIGFIAAPTRSGIVTKKSSSSWWKRALLAHTVALAGDNGDVHVIDEKVMLLEPWDRMSDALDAANVVAPPDAALPPGLELFPHEPLVVVHVPSMWAYKQWPVEYFVVLVKALVAAGARVALTGGTSNDDLIKVREVAASVSSGRLFDFCGCLDFAQLSALLKRSSMYIGPDTSVTHLAAAVGVQTIALFGPTNPVRWGPRGTAADSAIAWQRVGASQTRGNVHLMQGPGHCVPCSRAGCEDHRQSRSMCLEAITPDRVVAEALKIIRGEQPAQKAS